jgi:MFS family permease
MPLGRPATVAALGTAQTLAWASSYYLPAMLAAPMARDVGVAMPTVFAAFSVSLIVSALLGPYAGRAIDTWGGRPVLVATNLVFALGQSLIVWIAAGFVAELFIPLIIAGNNAIWQSKVPTDVQGRVFAAQSLVSDLPGPPGYLIAGPLADRLMEPAMQPGGALAGIFGPLVGVGPGCGIAATFIFTGVVGTAVSLGSYLLRGVRNVETELPDMHNPPEVELAVSGNL